MENEKTQKTSEKKTFTKIEITEIIVMGVLIVCYLIFVIMLPYFDIWDQIKNKIIIATVLLGVGILIQIVYFIWHKYREEIKEFIKNRKNPNE